MSGIKRIQEKHDESNREDRPVSREIWLKDGDQVFLTSIATGAEDDTFMDELYLFTFRVGTRWTNLLKDERVDASCVPDENQRPTHKFAFWAYVHCIMHTTRRNDSWVEVEGPGGRKMFREDVNDYKIIPLNFGLRQYIWNQFVDVYSDWNGLDKGVMRIKRTGSGQYDTSYSIATTARTEEIPEDRRAEAQELPTIKDYYFDTYGTPPNVEAVTSSSSEDNDTDLLF